MGTETAKRTLLDELMSIAKAMSAEKLRLLLLVAFKMRT